MTFLYEPEIKVDVAAEECAPLNDHDKNLVDPMGSGFIWYTPPLAATEEHSTGGQTWQISGHDMQVLTLSVPPNDIVVAEVGSFMFGSPFIKTDVELTLCTRKGFGEGCNRICGGESCVKVMLENESTQEGYIGLTPNFPGKIIPVKVRFVLFSFVLFASVGFFNDPKRLCCCFARLKLLIIDFSIYFSFSIYWEILVRNACQRKPFSHFATWNVYGAIR